MPNLLRIAFLELMLFAILLQSQYIHVLCHYVVVWYARIEDRKKEFRGINVNNHSVSSQCTDKQEYVMLGTLESKRESCDPCEPLRDVLDSVVAYHPYKASGPIELTVDRDDTLEVVNKE